MSMERIIDGKAFAARPRERVAGAVAELGHGHGLQPGLAVVLVGDDPASRVYVRNKAAQTAEAGMRSIEHRLPEDTSQENLLALIRDMNADDGVDGIRSEEHTSELQSLMRISYAVFCLKNKKQNT